MEYKENPLRRATSKFLAWCAEDTAAARFERSIVQGVIGIGVSGISAISGAPEWVQACVIPVTMAILAPIQAAIGKQD